MKAGLGKQPVVVVVVVAGGISVGNFAGGWRGKPGVGTLEQGGDGRVGHQFDHLGLHHVRILRGRSVHGSTGRRGEERDGVGRQGQIVVAVVGGGMREIGIVVVVVQVGG